MKSRRAAMIEEESFRDLMRRVRARDAEATAELARRYEPAIRWVVCTRLTDPALRRLLDWMDICQAVLSSFFVRAASGHFQVDTAEDLHKLLTTMARNQLISQAHKHRAARRDYRRNLANFVDAEQFVDPRPDPSQVVESQELLHE